MSDVPLPAEAIEAVREGVKTEVNRLADGQFPRETGAAPAGEFAVSPDELEALIVGWEALKTSIEQNDTALAEAARDALQPMAPDVVSGQVATRMGGAVTTALVGNMGMRDYATQYLASLKAMSPRYRGTDDSAASSFTGGV